MYKCKHNGMCDYKESGSICSFEGSCGAKEKTLDHLNADWRMFNANNYCSLGEVRWKIGNKIKEVRNED